MLEPAHSQIKVAKLLAGHEDQMHTYNFDLAQTDAALALVVDLSQRILDVTQKQSALVLMNPFTTYSWRHVVGIRMDIVRPQILQ